MRQINQFFKLIGNELYKSFFQKKTIAFLIVIILATCGLAYLFHDSDAKGDWRIEANQRVEKMEKERDQLAKDKTSNPSQLKELNDEIKLAKYKVAHNMPENQTTPLQFIYDCSMNIPVLILLFMAAFSADMIASEYSMGTIRQLLVKPVKRWKLFVAKFCSTFTVSSIMFLFYLVVTAIVGFIVFSGNDASLYTAKIIDGDIVKISMISTIAWTTLAQLFELIIVSTITYFIATLTRKSALAVVVSFVAFFGSAILGGLLEKYNFYKYILMPNLSLDTYLPGGWEPFKGATFGFSLTVCLVYAVVFFTAGLVIFNRRDVY